MNLQTLLGETPKTQFVEDYFFRLPFSSSGGAREMCRLGTWELLGEILGRDGVDVMVVREGRQHTGPDPTTVETARALSADGYTILVRHAETHHVELAKLAAAFADDFASNVRYARLISDRLTRIGASQGN